MIEDRKPVAMRHLPIEDADFVEAGHQQSI